MNHASRALLRGFGTALALSLVIGATHGAGSGATPQLVAAAAATPVATTRHRAAEEASFLAENDAAMERMMADMAVTPTGDIDRDFVAMMVPHHQGAIDMALAELRYGKNEQLKRLAQEIIVTQLQEIAAMHLAVGDPLPPSIPSPTSPIPPAASEEPYMHGPMTMPDQSMN